MLTFLLTFSVIWESGLVSSVCSLSGNNHRQVVPMHDACASVTKQYKLVLVTCGDAIRLG